MLKDDELIGVDRHLPPGGPAVHRQADRAGAELRRPGRHRHREHAAAQRTAPAHRRSQRIAGAADRDREVLKVISSSPGELAAGVRRHAGECHAHLRGQVRHICCCARATLSGSSRCTAHRRPTRTMAVASPSSTRHDNRHCRSAASRSQAPSRSPICGRPRLSRARSPYGGAASRSPARGRSSPSRCSRTTSWSAPSPSTARRSALHRQADRAGAELRRPGRHRHREHAAAQRAAPAHRRSDRSRWSSRPRPREVLQGHLQLARRLAAGVRHACWRTRRGSARPSSARSVLRGRRHSAPRRSTALPPDYAEHCASARVHGPAVPTVRHAIDPQTDRSRSPTCRPTEAYSTASPAVSSVDSAARDRSGRADAQGR